MNHIPQRLSAVCIPFVISDGRYKSNFLSLSLLVIMDWFNSSCLYSPCLFHYISQMTLLEKKAMFLWVIISKCIKITELTELHYCCPIWAGVAKLSLFRLDRFQKSLHGHQRLKPFSYRQNGSSLLLLYHYFHAKCSDELPIF